ncbi:MAG: hypothetical protein ABL973_00610 [Micropepsaceae bacterium]
MANVVWTGAVAGTLAVVAAAAAFGYSSFMDTDTSNPTLRGRQGPPPESQMMRFDADKDGRVSRPELDGALMSEFRGVDTNGDGRLDAAEIQRHIDTRRADRTARIEAWRAKAKAQGIDPKKVPPELDERDNIDTLRYADWNMDGVITPDEFGGRARAQFMRTDRNSDGLISPNEIRQRSNNRKGNSA